MVTRLSGTPSFAKSRLKKLIKAASGGLFYARQRVTTEGKAMEERRFSTWSLDSRSTQQHKRDWLDSKVASLIRAGHTKKFARERAKQLYRDLSR